MIMLIFEDGEEAVIQNILSMAGTKARVYEAGFQDRCTLAFPDMVIDERQHVVPREGRKEEFTGTEFEILNLLAKHPDMVFGREQIYSAVWLWPNSEFVTVADWKSEEEGIEALRDDLIA